MKQERLTKPDKRENAIPYSPIDTTWETCASQMVKLGKLEDAIDKLSQTKGEILLNLSFIKQHMFSKEYKKTLNDLLDFLMEVLPNEDI